MNRSNWAEARYRKEVEHLGLERLAGLIKICGFLTQTKAYLFWKMKPDEPAGCY